MISVGHKSRIVRYHNEGLLAREIADRMGLPFEAVIAFLRTRRGYPGHIPKNRSRIDTDGLRRFSSARVVSLPRVKCLEA